MTFEFNSKETYLQYRAEWKAKYEQATLDVRAAREAVRVASRELAKNYRTYSYLVHARGSEEAKAYYAASNALMKAEMERSNCRSNARELLEELAEAKKEANRQWIALRTANRI